MRQRTLSIAVLLGGPAAERSISLKSGAAVATALAARGHRVRRIDPNPDLGAVDRLGGSELLAEAAWNVAGVDWNTIDVVCNTLHGPFGEDGQVQRLLDDVGVPYTGSPAVASREGFHKSLAKARFRAAGVPTPRGVECASNWSTPRLRQAARSLGYPLVVKPDAQGSSLGVTIVRAESELSAAIERCFEYGPVLLLEEFIAGTEWTVPVWDDEVLPIIQIVSAQDFYDFDAKYADDRTEYRFEFEAPADIVAAITEAARAAARALGAQGLARADVRLSHDGRPVVLEVNTSPGMTDHSLVPKAAERMGLSLGELCEQDCLRAMARRGRGQTRRSA